MPSDPTPRPNPTPGGKPRRRPAPGGGGNWVWMLILLVLVGMFLVNSLEPSGAIEWGDAIGFRSEETREVGLEAHRYDDDAVVGLFGQ